jgi:hypothetical protein
MHSASVEKEEEKLRYMVKQDKTNKRQSMQVF